MRGALGIRGRPTTCPYRGDSLAVESQAWDRRAACKPLPPGRLSQDEVCSVRAPPRAPVPRSFWPPSSFRAVESPAARRAGPQASLEPPSPRRGESGHAPRLCWAPSALASVFADTQSGDEASASLGVGVWVGGRRSRSWRVWGVELVFRTRVLERFAPKHRSKLGGVAADSRRPHSPAENWGVASCQPRWGQLRLPKQASSRPASLPRRATCGGRWQEPS